MRIAICDDLLEQIEIIKNATLEYFKPQKIPIEIETFNKAFDFLDAHHQSVILNDGTIIKTV
ncbi:MAG: hypothetical protein RBS25_02750 [Bacilli bacterium]|jgi:hypothetical protein|nr:hypothetical protein [Bacilli bacterium]